MEYSEAKKYADNGEITLCLTGNEDIGEAHFSIDGIEIRMLFSIDNRGLFGVEITLEDLLKLAGKIKPQSDGDKGSNPPDKESL